MINFSFSERLPQLLRENRPLIILTIFLMAGLHFLGQIGFIMAIILCVIIHWARKTKWDELGLSRPKSWWKTVLLGILCTLVIMTVFMTVINPLIFELFPPESKDLSRFNGIKDNGWMLMGGLLSAWGTAGLAEELIWRGYIMKNIAQILGNKNVAWISSLILSAGVFGLLHFYQGPVGILQTGIMGLFLGIMYMVNGKKNLWLNIMVHGLIDTIGMIALYLDMA